MNIYQGVLNDALSSLIAGKEQQLLSYLPELSLRPSPSIVPWAVVLLDNPSISAAKVAELVSLDPVLASRALSLANAPAPLVSGLCLTIDEALMRIGLARSRGLVLALTLPELHRRSSTLGDDETAGERDISEWKRGIKRSIVARELVKNSRAASPDEVYTCALVTSCVHSVRVSLRRQVLDELSQSGLDLHIALSILVGVEQNWPPEWIAIACQQSPQWQDLPQFPVNKISQTISFASALAEVLPQEISGAQANVILALAKEIDISEAALKRVSASATKAIRERLSQFGIRD